MRNLKNLVPITLFIIILLSSASLYAQGVKRQFVRFAYLADLHVSDVVSNIEDLEISIADINTLKDIDFVVFAGDITEFGSDKEIEIAKSIISRLNVPYYVLSGNHDSKWSESGCNTFAKVFGYEYFSFEKNGIQFIGTNSGPNMRMAPALVPREAMVWLDSVTRALPREMPVVFINHYPLDDAMLNYAHVIDMLKRVNIQVSLCGHGHSNRVLDFSGVRGVMGRSNLRAGKVAAGHAGYNIVTIETGGATATASAGISATATTGISATANIKASASTNTSSSADASKNKKASTKATAATNKKTTSATNKKASVSAYTSTTTSATANSVTVAYVDASPNSTTNTSSKTDSGSEYSLGKISFAVRSNGITQEPWHSIPLLKHSANPVMHAPVDVVWEYQDDSDIGSAAAFAFGNVYISNTAGVIKSLDAADGSLKWSFATGGKVFSSPEVCEKSAILVVGSSDNFIYGLDAHSGKLLWKVEAAKSVLGSPSMLGDLVYIGASDGVFRAIDIKSGRVVWSYTGIKSFIEAKPWADAEGVYIGDWANRVYAFEPKSGKLMWEWTNRKGRGLSAAAVWPVKANGKLFVVTPERRSHAIDALTGKELWSARGGREAIGLSQDSSAVYIKTMQDTVIAFSTGDYNIAATSGTANISSTAGSAGSTVSTGTAGTTISAASAGSTVSASTAASTGTASLASSAASAGSTSSAAYTSNPTFGNPAEYNAAANSTGNTPIKLWESHTGYGYEIAPSPMTTANGLIFVPTDKGNIFALNAADGTVAWQYRFSIALINYIRPITYNQKATAQPNNRLLLVTSMDGKVALLSY